MVDFAYLMSPEGKEEIRRKRIEKLFEEEKEERLRLVTCSITGHRPDKLPGGYDWKSDRNVQLGIRIRDEMINLIEKCNVSRFIFGGALGVDQMAFSVCKKLKDKFYPELHTILALPFENQFVKWNTDSIDRYKLQLKVADEVILVDELKDIRYVNNEHIKKEFAPEKLQNRNEWMIDHSNFTIFVWDGSKGGTSNCIKYIGKKIGSGRMVIRIRPDKLNVESEVWYS